MILAIFLVLLTLFVVLPLVGVLVWFLIWNALIGIALGGLARLVVPGRQPIGVLATIVCGWIGALVGGLIAAAAFGGYDENWFGTILIEIGVAAVSVLAFSAGARNSAVVQRKSDDGHKVIDV